MNNIPRIIILLTLVFSIISCEEDPSQLGEDLLPPSDDFVLAADSSAVISASMVPFDTIVTHYSYYSSSYGGYYDSDTLNLLGDYSDNVFGRKTADLTLRFIPDFDAITLGARVDSLVIYLKVDSILLGDPKANLTYRVYKIIKPIDTRSLIYSYSDLTKDTSGNKIIDDIIVAEGTFNFNSKTIRIPITNSDVKTQIANLTENDIKDSVFVNKILNGFYVKVEKQDPNGAIALLTTGESLYSTTKMTFYYNDTSVNFYSGGSLSNNVPYDYNGAFSLKTDVTNSLIETETNHVLIQGLLGSFAKLDFQNPAEVWRDSGVIAVNKAELVIRPSKDLLSPYITEAKCPSKLEMYYKIKQSNGKIKNVQIATSTFKDGVYLFNITSYYQNLLRKKIQYSPIYIKDYNTVYSAGILAFDKTGVTKLKILYSKLK